jgi:multicomponent Na+:H+ antiporter subunit E
MIRAIIARALAYALVWWALTGGRADNWGLGLAAVVLAVAASLVLSPPGPGRFSGAGLAAFAGFFLIQSVRGGVQVAAMALRPRLDLAPAILELPLGLPPGPARVWLVATLTLLPGTLGVGIAGDRLRLHVLDRRRPIEAEVRAAEARIARMLGTTT